MPSRFFPPANSADVDGLVLVGGQLTVERLLDAYRHGIFPWPHYVVDPMLWWSPDPRAVMPLDGLHVSRRLERRLRRGEFQFSVNKAFESVLNGCAYGPGRAGGTWLFPSMIAAYTELHRLGFAHSVEVWIDDKLAGGVYGVAIGGLFAAESMFHYVRDASKAALFELVRRLNDQGYALLDIQQWTPHTGRLGAVEMSRAQYLEELARALQRDCCFV
ncbi:MAG: leucyl/phenylalanyl-tRNA--protein transferase [Planctomycetales bacterium]|nr:leucyl/phenylalanyl-tRNA--protein transferase [Planctomycetales bacterium]